MGDTGMAPGNASSTDTQITNLNDKPKFIRSVNLFTAVALCVGQIVGAGIFIAPQGVILTTGSVGLSLIVWGLSGVIAMGAALCYAELATMIKESGGSWAYIRCGFGGAPAFVVSIVRMVAGTAGSALTIKVSAEYLVTPLLDDCSKSPEIINILSICILLLINYINSSTLWTQRLLKFALVVKSLTLLSLVVGGWYWMSTKGTVHLTDPFRGTTKNGWSVAVSFYSGLYAYSGFYNITAVTEEVKNYKRNIPLSIFLSLSVITIIYIFIMLSYYSVLGTYGVLSSDVVVLEWAEALFGSWGILYSFLVFISAFGSTLAGTFSSSRSLACLAREGHTIQLLAMVDVNHSIPIISLIWKAILGSTFVLASGSLVVLMNFSSFMGSLINIGVMLSLIKLKLQKYNNDEDRFRVPLALPIVMTLVYIYLALVPVINNPNWYYLYGIIISMCSLILYFPFVKFSAQLSCFDKVTVFFQCLFGVAVPDKLV